METNNSVVFLHLSDMHIKDKKDISYLHIEKIVSSLRSYKNIKFQKVIIILSGDITQSGEESQFDNAKKLMGNLIIKLNKEFNCECVILTVPGNHDVNHGDYLLNLEYLKKELYSQVEIAEHGKLTSFYNFAKFNKCFQESEMYCDIKIIDIDGFKIQANLINNAILSTTDQYKGLLYIPGDKIQLLSEKNDTDFVISIMHHAPDFYRDDIKNLIENTVIKNSNILFHGHEHYNYSKNMSFDGSNGTIMQSGGCLCHNGDWRNSSYIVGILNINTLEYNHSKFVWNEESAQYEHDNIKMEYIGKIKTNSNITDEFLEFIHDDNEGKYYVFPSTIFHGGDSTKDYLIDSFDKFKEKLQEYQYSVIVGSSNIGKTTLLKQIFESFAEDYFVLYCNPEKIIEKNGKSALLPENAG